jgi:hypothetical protein
MNFQKIASKYGVTLTDIDHDGYGRNGGGSGGGEISSQLPPPKGGGFLSQVKEIVQVSRRKEDI